MAWLIVLAVIILLAILPLGASAIYDREGAEVRLIAGLIRFQIFPKKKKASPKKEKAKKSKKAKDKEESKSQSPTTAEKTENKQGGSIRDFLPLVRVGLDMLNDLRRKLRVNRLEVNLVMAGDDPCDLAVNYGRAWTAIGNLMPQLERFFVIKKRDVQVNCDFTQNETTVYARLDITITLGRLISLAVRYGYRAPREYLKIKKLRKGGAI